MSEKRSEIMKEFGFSRKERVGLFLKDVLASAARNTPSFGYPFPSQVAIDSKRVARMKEEQGGELSLGEEAWLNGLADRHIWTYPDGSIAKMVVLPAGLELHPQEQMLRRIDDITGPVMYRGVVTPEMYDDIVAE